MYFKIIKDYYELFSKKNVKVICYENLWNPDNGLNFIFNEFDINVNLTKNS